MVQRRARASMECICNWMEYIIQNSVNCYVRVNDKKSQRKNHEHTEILNKQSKNQLNACHVILLIPKISLFEVLDNLKPLKNMESQTDRLRQVKKC